MAHFTAQPEHIERVLDPRGETLAQLAVRLDDGSGQVFLDSEGRLCVVEADRPPFYEREEVRGTRLERLFDAYGVDTDDLACLRGRMIVEGAWAPQDVLVDDGRLYVFGDPGLAPIDPLRRDL